MKWRRQSLPSTVVISIINLFPFCITPSNDEGDAREAFDSLNIDHGVSIQAYTPLSNEYLWISIRLYTLLLHDNLYKYARLRDSIRFYQGKTFYQKEIKHRCRKKGTDRWRIHRVFDAAMTLRELLEAVKDEKLPLPLLEKYRDEMVHLRTAILFERAELKKKQALYLVSSEEKSYASKKMAWDVTTEGQRLFTIEGYTSSINAELESLTSRVWAHLRVS